MNIKLKCGCGKIEGNIEGPFRKKHSRAVCMCDDCQTYAHYLGKPSEILDANGGTEVIALYPSQIHFSRGFENLKCVRLSPKGIFRWYAGCCNTAVANLALPGLPFTGMIHTCIDLNKKEMDTIFGPIFVRFLAKFGKPPFPPNTDQGRSWKLILTTLPFLAKGFLIKKYKKGPFFDEKGLPTVLPYILTKSEREKFKPKVS